MGAVCRTIGKLAREFAEVATCFETIQQHLPLGQCFFFVAARNENLLPLHSWLDLVVRSVLLVAGKQLITTEFAFLHRLSANPFTKVPKADAKLDRRRQRRSMTEAELMQLLDVARWRPLAEYGRETTAPDDTQSEGVGNRRKRSNWKLAALTLDGLQAAVVRARERLTHNFEFVAKLERLGRERALIYKTLVLTGLRKGELASLTVGQLDLDSPMPFVELNAADEKNRQGSTIPLRLDLAIDLREWLSDPPSVSTLRLRDHNSDARAIAHEVTN